jgi:Pentapeptide repeats (8 copies)
MIASLAFIACTILSAILLVRLGWEAFWSKLPDNQEIIKNFLLAFASTFGIPFLI